MVATTVFDLRKYAEEKRAIIEKRLDEYVTVSEPNLLWQSIRYSVLQGGKRIRALLCLAAAEAAAVQVEGGVAADELSLPCACAIEMVHAMSLIHDDLPCMDNDDFRRGKPTNHKVFGEAMALLAGDALLVYASDILITKTPKSVDREVLLDIAAELARALGPNGMVGGQAADLIATGLVNAGGRSEPISADLLELIHKQKTGALLRFSVWSGARLAGAEQDTLKSLARYGEVLGLAFQIADDLLDVTGDIATLGKTPGKDEATGKLTWVTLFGVEGSTRTLDKLKDEGKTLLKCTGLPSSSVVPLQALLEYAVHRTN